jgi:hypothetical protein
VSQIDDQEVLLTLRAQLLTVAGLPAAADRVFDNAYVVVGGVKQPYSPKPGMPYLTEKLVPATSALQTNTPRGLVVDTGLYILTWFGITGDGSSAIRAGANAIKTAFKIGTTLTTTSGNIVRVRTESGPVAGQIIDLTEGGHSYCQITVPYEVQWNQP